MALVGPHAAPNPNKEDTMKSAKKNKLFNDEVSRIAINAGTEIHIARNCLRWRNANVSKSIPQKKDYTYGLSPEKLMGPMNRKISFGTNPNTETFNDVFFRMDSQFGSVDYEMLIRFGTMVNYKGTLYTSQEWKEMNNVG
jgi:hypothetical protein